VLHQPTTAGTVNGRRAVLKTSELGKHLTTALTLKRRPRHPVDLVVVAGATTST
jgi:hypothetical protein